MTEKEPIKFSDIKVILTALKDLINQFPELPPQVQEDGVFFEQLKPREIGLCLSTVPSNSVKIKEYVCGKYIGRYTFKLIFQKMSVSNTQRINAQDILEKISNWLEKNPIEKEDGTVYQLDKYPELGNGRKIKKIVKTSFARIVQRLEPNIEISEVNLYLDYEVKPKLF